MADGRREIQAMGVGGLIRSAPEAEEDPDAVEPAPQRSAAGRRIAALVLAAGSSRRMAGSNKLLQPVAGVPMVRRAANAALASRASHGRRHRPSRPTSCRGEPRRAGPRIRPQCRA
jgi:hypothetical protein